MAKIKNTDTETKRSFLQMMGDIGKKYKKLFICIGIVALIFLAVIVIVSQIHAEKAMDLTKAQIGKCYMETQDEYTTIHYFTSDGAARFFVHYEDGKVGFVTGSVDEVTDQYHFKISLWGTPYLIYTNSVTPAIFDENGDIIKYGFPWQRISLEEAREFEQKCYEEYALKNCTHTFGNAQITVEATCSQNGKSKQTCSVCGYEKITETQKREHNYVNKVCTVCGEKKKAEISNIKANTWYTYDSVLHVQNCLVKNAVSVNQGKKMSVQYFAVCQYCHAIEESSKLAGPEVNYEVKKVHYCSECGEQTLVKLKIE